MFLMAAILFNRKKLYTVLQITTEQLSPRLLTLILIWKPIKTEIKLLKQVL